uniref:Tyrosine-protein phosphatase domain-containing protein n=1 Tax=Caenorhabditis brenneri TaxID=135651 RepID=B6VBD5_CAEBE|nr:hypothetical protein Cbre_JD05.003 [Caenorhabditis brenneri]ACI49156.1 hypothetical protein Cbre_JD21.003 [Caenorhabditis brenneri]
MLNDDSQAGPLAIQDSQDFLEGDFSSDVVLKPTGSLRLSGYRHRRQKTAPFDETMQRIHMIAGVTSSIYIQGAIFNGTINSNELISEMLRFNPVTPDQINAFDYAKFEGALNQLKELPGKVETGGGIEELEKFFGFVHKVVEQIKGVKNVEQWPDKDDFKKDLVRMHTNGGEISFATDVGEILRNWQSFHSFVEKKKATFQHFKDLIDASNEILTAGGASASIPEVFTFTNKKPPSKSVEFVRKVINAVKLIDANSLRKPGTGFDELTSKVQAVKDTLTSLQDIQAHLDHIENFFKSRALPWNLSPIKYTAGLPEGFKDVRQMLNDLEQDWSLAIVKSKYLLGSFSSIKSLDNKVSEIDTSLGVGAEEIAETVTNIIRTSSHLATTFSSFETNNAKDVVQCHFIPDNVKADELGELITFATEIEDEITNLKNGIKTLKTSLSNKEGQEHLRALVAAFGKPAENDQASLNAAMDKVLNSTSLEGAKTFVDGLADQANGISSKNLKDKAKKTFDKISSFEKFVKDHKDKHLKILQCFIGKKETGSTVDVIKKMQDIRSAQQHYVDMVDKGLGGIKKVVGIKDKLTALDKTITDLKGKNPDSQKLLNMFVDPEKHSNIVGFSTRGVFNMKRVLNLQQNSKYYKPHEKLVETEANKHSKKLTKEQVDILKKYPSISTELDVLLPILNDFPGKFSSKNMVNLTDFPEIFIQAKDVVGTPLDFGQMVKALDVLILQQNSKSSQEQTLKAIRKNLVGLSSMGLDFASYHQYYDKYKDSAQALDLFFTALSKAGSMTTPAPLSQNNQNGFSSVRNGNSSVRNGSDESTSSDKNIIIGVLSGLLFGTFTLGGFLVYRQRKNRFKPHKLLISPYKPILVSRKSMIGYLRSFLTTLSDFAFKFGLECPDRQMLHYLDADLNQKRHDDFLEAKRISTLTPEQKQAEGITKDSPKTMEKWLEALNRPEQVQMDETPSRHRLTSKKNGRLFFKFCKYYHFAVDGNINKALESYLKKHEDEYRDDIPLNTVTRITFPTDKKSEVSFETDFYHGNRVYLKNGLKTILMQPPMIEIKGKKSNVKKFWYLVKNENVKHIAMLCDFTEKSANYKKPRKKEKVVCEEYFPTQIDGVKIFDGFTVTCTGIDNKEDNGRNHTRTYHLSLKFDGEKGKTKDKKSGEKEKVHTVSLMRYIGFVDQCAPVYPKDLAEMLCELRQHGDSPIIVLCSDGVGRSGVFDYMEMLYQAIATSENESGDVDYGQVLRELRNQRAGCVPDALMFAFSLMAIIDMLCLTADPTEVLDPGITTFIDNFRAAYLEAVELFKDEYVDKFAKDTEEEEDFLKRIGACE